MHRMSNGKQASGTSAPAQQGHSGEGAELVGHTGQAYKEELV